jgi:hypothetical protein
LGHRLGEVAPRAPGAYALVVVCEAAADGRTATGLADRVLCHEVEWIEPEALPGLRTWRGLDDGETHAAWKSLKHRALGPGALPHSPHGKFRDEPGALDARAARKALLLALQTSPDAVLLIRDSDGRDDRRRGLEQARALGWDFPVILGVAHPEREAWVVAGFEPRTAAEAEVLAHLLRELGFDPRLEAHRLRAGARAPKGVLQRLTAGDPTREETCWSEGDLARLADRGSATGLAAYLKELRQYLVPVVSGPRAAARERPRPARRAPP